MIKYALACARRHQFESWFQSSDAYEAQAKRGLVTCPVCGSAKVDKALMAPSLSRTKKRRAPAHQAETRNAEPAGKETRSAGPATPVAMVSPQEQVFRQRLKELRDHLTKNADYVGGRFPEEARRMHYGEIEHRSIYGEASPEDARSLAEEGIEFHPIPVLPDDRN